MAERVRSFRVLREKQLPPLCDMLGWCTWDAFYADVEAEGVLRGMCVVCVRVCVCVCVCVLCVCVCVICDIYIIYII